VSRLKGGNRRGRVQVRTGSQPERKTQPTGCAAALQKPARLGLEVWVGEPQRGEITKPRPKVRRSRWRTEGLGQRNHHQPLSPEGAKQSMRDVRRARAIAPGGTPISPFQGSGGINTPFKPRPLAWASLFRPIGPQETAWGWRLDPGLQPGLRYFAPLGLKSAKPPSMPEA